MEDEFARNMCHESYQDGLRGFPKTIKNVLSQAEIRLYIVHQICNLLKGNH